MKASKGPVFTQAQINKLVMDMLKKYRKYHDTMRAYAKKGKDPDDVPQPRYSISDQLEQVFIPLYLTWEEVETLAQKHSKHYGKMPVEFSDRFMEKLLDKVAEQNADAFATLFVCNGSNVGDVENLEGEDEDDE